MSIVSQKVTAEELLHLPRGKVRHELVKGVLLTMSPSGSEHGVVTFQFSALIAQFVSSTGAGLAFGAETGFVIQRDPDTVRAPDIAFIRRERIPTEWLPQGYWPGAPDLAVEVMSPGDTARAKIDEKANDWLRAGTLAVWVVDPRLEENHRVFSRRDDQHAGRGFDPDGGDVLPGFRCAIADVFRFPSM